MRYTQDLQFEPRLAEKYERIDDKTVRFHLRKGVKFHSGNDFTADDVVWTVNRLKASGLQGDLRPHRRSQEGG
jgi:peptide/nickel transport system substrate-binding protein